MSSTTTGNVLRVSQTKIDREFSGKPQYQKYEAQLKAIDKNGDGEIDIVELCQKIDEMSVIENQVRLLKWAAIVTGLFALLTIASVVGLVYAVVVLTKDTNVSSSGIMVTKNAAATPIATGQAITLDSTSNLYSKSLEDLANLSFLIIPATDGGRVIRVAEVQLLANTSATVTTDAGNVYVIDAAGIHQVVKNQTGMRKLLDVDTDIGQTAFIVPSIMKPPGRYCKPVKGTVVCSCNCNIYSDPVCHQLSIDCYEAQDIPPKRTVPQILVPVSLAKEGKCYSEPIRLTLVCSCNCGIYSDPVCHQLSIDCYEAQDRPPERTVIPRKTVSAVHRV